MKTILLKAVGWLFPMTVFLMLVVLLKLNIYNRLDELISSQDLESFLYEMIKESFQEKVESPILNTSSPMTESPDQLAMLDYINTADQLLVATSGEKINKSLYSYSLKVNGLSSLPKVVDFQGTASNAVDWRKTTRLEMNDPEFQNQCKGDISKVLKCKEEMIDIESCTPVDHICPEEGMAEWIIYPSKAVKCQEQLSIAHPSSTPAFNQQGF